MEKRGEEVTVELIVDVAESIDDIVKFTFDIPSKHKNGKIAILDVEVSISRDPRVFETFKEY